MAKHEEEEETPDSLELTSIGHMYSGPLEKKYWSSSRGKDRHPFPVGYHAARAYRGSICRLEINEGPKGPLFVITGATRQSFSGQTPNIAWDNFQKKGFTHAKIWHGKRSSRKIDGTEFFGFKNPSVQRLLRELVSSVNGKTEQNLPSSSLYDVTSLNKHDTGSPEACKPSSLPSHLVRPRTTGKRIRRTEITKSTSVSELKRSRSQHNSHSIPGICAPSSSIEILQNEGCTDAIQSFGLADHVKDKTVPFSEENKMISLGKSGFICLVSSGNVEEKHLCSSGDTQRKECSSQILEEGEDRDEPDGADPKNSPAFRQLNLYAPDTLDSIHDNVDNAPRTRDQFNYSVKEEMKSANIFVSEGLVTESHREAGNPKSGKSDIDSDDQEMVKLMMTVLLPQAIPLLKKHPKKRNESTHLETLTPRPSRCFTDVDLPAADLASFVPDSEHNKSVALDSFEDDQLMERTTDQLVVNPLKTADQTNCYSDNHPDIKGPTIFSGETFRDRSKLHNNEAHVDPLPFHIGATLHRKKPYSENQAVSANPEKNLADLEIKSEEKQSSQDCTEGVVTNNTSPTTNLNGEVGVFEMGIEVHSKVYTKKNRAKNCFLVVPIAEGNTRISFGDAAVSKTAEASVVLDTHLIATNNKPYPDVFGDEAMLWEQSYDIQVENTTMASNAVLEDMRPILFHEVLHCASAVNSNLKVPDPLASHIAKPQDSSANRLTGCRNLSGFDTSVQSRNHGAGFGDNWMSVVDEVKATLGPTNSTLELRNELEGKVDLVGCYSHPLPITSLLLRTKGSDIYVCVLCGLLDDSNQTLLYYKVATKESELGFPSFLGHTLVQWSSSRANREIAKEISVLQFTPDAQCLVLLDNIRTPCCRLGKIDCLCPTCTSDSFEDNAVKVVQIKAGYVSVVKKLKTFENVKFILVCEPNHLIAVSEDGSLNIWAMNSTWSKATEGFSIASNHCLSPSIVELKKIPKCASLVIGHNGFGDFTIWDISRRVAVSSFSSPTSSVFQISPICLINRESKQHFNNNPIKEDHVDGLMTATTLRLTVQKEDLNSQQLNWDNIAVWLLVSTVPDSCGHTSCMPSACHSSSVGWWRLALLVNNTVVFGNALDPRAVAIGVSADHGIIGTRNGLVYMWEFSTGSKLGSLHDFKGSSVSCIATDDSRSSILAVASDGGQLLVFQKSQDDD